MSTRSPKKETKEVRTVNNGPAVGGPTEGATGLILGDLCWTNGEHRTWFLYPSLKSTQDALTLWVPPMWDPCSTTNPGQGVVVVRYMTHQLGGPVEAILPGTLVVPVELDGLACRVMTHQSHPTVTGGATPDTTPRMGWIILPWLLPALYDQHYRHLPPVFRNNP